MAHGKVRVARLLRTYGGEALAKVFEPVVKAVVNAVAELAAMQAARKESVEDILPEDEPMLTFFEPEMATVYDDAHPDGWCPVQVREEFDAGLMEFNALVDALAADVDAYDADADDDDRTMLGALSERRESLRKMVDGLVEMTDDYAQAMADYERERVTAQAAEDAYLRKHPLWGCPVRHPYPPSTWQVGRRQHLFIDGNEVVGLPVAIGRLCDLDHRLSALRHGDADCTDQGVSIDVLFPD